MVAATAIADAMGCEERTIRRIIDDFERVSEVPDVVIKALQQAGFDPAARKNAGMIAKILGMPDKPADLDLDIAVTEAALATKVAEQIGRSRGAVVAALMPPEKRRRLAVRQKIRTALTSVPAEQKLAELVAAIEEEMYSEWGQVEPVTITITPHAPDSPNSSRTSWNWLHDGSRPTGNPDYEAVYGPHPPDPSTPQQRSTPVGELRAQNGIASQSGRLISANRASGDSSVDPIDEEATCC